MFLLQKEEFRTGSCCFSSTYIYLLGFDMRVMCIKTRHKDRQHNIYYVSQSLRNFVQKAMSSLRLNIYLIIVIIFGLITIIDSSGGADWNAPNIVIQGGQWVEIPAEYYDGSNLSEYPQPPSPYNDNWKKNDTKIIVLIASFRETKCKYTLLNLFGKASNPNRIYIGIVQQNEPGQDEDCVYEYCKLMDKDGKYSDNKDEDWNENNCPYFNNIKANRMLAADAKGPVYARALQVKYLNI